MQNYKILLVEDDPRLVEMLAGHFAKHSWDTVSVSTGWEAIDSFRRNLPDLVILDRNLPDQDGIDVCKSLVSHELRRPLTTLQLSIETLLEAEARDKSEDRNKPNYLEQALGCSNELSNLIQDLFELSCLDARESLPEASLFDLKELCQDMLEVFSLKHKERSISFNTCGSLDSYIVKADEVLILRALSNLVENAVKYSNITDTIEISLALRGGKIHVSVEDTGIGIKKEEIPLVFERFYRSAGKSPTSSAGTQVESGAGLGLAITKRIIELHGSSITLLSEPGVRTVFSFTLGHSTNF